MKGLKVLTILGTIAGVALVAACWAGDMGKEQIVLFSALDGRVIKDGRPVAGATLIREWEFGAAEVKSQDSTTTDELGRFHFDAVLYGYRKPRFFVQEPLIAQVIRVSTGALETQVWFASKHNFLAGREDDTVPITGTAPEIPLRITIDLDAPERRRGQVYGHTLFDSPL